MVLHGVLADAQIDGDIAVRLALGEVAQHIAFASREFRPEVRAPRVGEPGCGGQAFGRQGADPRVATLAALCSEAREDVVGHLEAHVASGLPRGVVADEGVPGDDLQPEG